MTARALLVVPPFIKCNAGPLLGPALLQAAARSSGHLCSTLDMNALWIQRHGKATPPMRINNNRPRFQGGHNKPLDDSSLNGERKWNETLLGSASSCLDGEDLLRRLKFGFMSHQELGDTAKRLVDSPFGEWARKHLEASCVGTLNQTVDVIGLSLLHAGQVVPSVTTSMIARELWPNALIAWGGPHVNGLGQSILEDLEMRTALAGDVFVQGHAEETFLTLLDQVGGDKHTDKLHSVWLPSPVPRGLRGKCMQIPLVPSFAALDVHSPPTTLPVQSSLGCAFGKCAFCACPAMEGKPVQLSLQSTVIPMVEKAIELGPKHCSGVSFEDSLVTTKRLKDIAACVEGSVPWSACTKLSPRLSNGETLTKLTSGGLATLEVGLESLLPESQQRIGKIQSQELFESFIVKAAMEKDLSVVVNCTTGFPWEDSQQSQAKLELAHDIVNHHLGLRGKVEHNAFELERLSPVAQNPEKCCMRKEDLKMWPWASVIETCSDGTA